MNTKRFTEINGHEALKKLIQDENIFNAAGQKYYIKNSKLVRDYAGIEALDSGLTIEEVLGETWYIKKPFDVRAEMLARPNEWVGAFEELINQRKVWQKVKFDTKRMCVVNTDLISKYESETYDFPEWELDNCIQIEDVPKEEL